MTSIVSDACFPGTILRKAGLVDFITPQQLIPLVQGFVTVPSVVMLTAKKAVPGEIDDA